MVNMAINENIASQTNECSHIEYDDGNIGLILDIQPDINTKATNNLSIYDFSIHPIHVKSVKNEYLLKDYNNFLKGCKWSPDGSCIVTNSEDHIIRLYNLPNEFYKLPFEGDIESSMSPVIKIKENDLIYDYSWYPKMNSLDPNTCFLLTTSKGNPIHLWNCYTGKLDSTFSPYNNVDEVISAYSLSFSPDGSKIYSGFVNSIKVFYTERPGRIFDNRLTYVQKSGQHGIISCIAFNPVNPSIYALGSYSRQLGFYDEKCGDAICILIGQKGGITHLMFSLDGTKLYSGARMDSEIMCWDMRKLGEVCYSLNRIVRTNQRIYFDLSPCDSWLISGSDDGSIYLFNVNDTLNKNEDGSLKPTKIHNISKQSVNGLSVHCTLPIIATSSGCRIYPEQSDSEDERNETTFKTQIDASLDLLWFQKEEYLRSQH